MSSPTEREASAVSNSTGILPVTSMHLLTQAADRLRIRTDARIQWASECGIDEGRLIKLRRETQPEEPVQTYSTPLTRLLIMYVHSLNSLRGSGFMFVRKPVNTYFKRRHVFFAAASL